MGSKRANEIEKLVNMALECASGIQYNSFTTSVRVPKEWLKEEEDLIKREGLRSNSLKSELNRRAREIICNKTGKEAKAEGDIMFVFDLRSHDCSVKINPIFLLCRYNKYSRNLSQTRWDKYKSVEDYIVDAAGVLFNSDNAYLHGAGREDVDVQMLGDGRLCVIEIENPKTRDVDLDAFEKLVLELSKGDVELQVLKRVNRPFVSIVKLARLDKLYEAVVEFNEDVNEQTLKNICVIERVEQRTPLRVVHRRADKVRVREIKSVHAKKLNGTYSFIIRCESGTYIKELISGDDGRTCPSFSSIAGCHAKCVQLDVIKLFDEYIVDWW